MSITITSLVTRPATIKDYTKIFQLEQDEVGNYQTMTDQDKSALLKKFMDAFLTIQKIFDNHYYFLAEDAGEIVGIIWKFPSKLFGDCFELKITIPNKSNWSTYQEIADALLSNVKEANVACYVPENDETLQKYLKSKLFSVVENGGFAIGPISKTLTPQKLFYKIAD